METRSVSSYPTNAEVVRMQASISQLSLSQRMRRWRKWWLALVTTLVLSHVLVAQPNPPSRPILFVHGWCGSAYEWAPFFDPANQYRLSALFPAGLYTNPDVYLVEYNRKANTIGFW